MSTELLQQPEIIALLERIATTLERVEEVLIEKQSKTTEGKDAKQLMQSLVKYYRETEPHYEIQIGSQLQVYRFRNAICKIKNIQNTKRETRKIYKWIKLLEDREFITRTNDSTFEVLSTGDWWGTE